MLTFLCRPGYIARRKMSPIHVTLKAGVSQSLTQKQFIFDTRVKTRHKLPLYCIDKIKTILIYLTIVCYLSDFALIASEKS